METKELKPQLGISAESDFEYNTWTFQMFDDFEVTAGQFMIVPIEQWNTSPNDNALVEALEEVMRLKDLWLITDDNCPPEHRGEAEALARMKYIVEQALSTHKDK